VEELFVLCVVAASPQQRTKRVLRFRGNEGGNSMQQAQPQKNASIMDRLTEGVGGLIVSISIPIITFLLLWASFVFLRDTEAPKILIALVALLVGVGGVWMLYISGNQLIERLPDVWRDKLRPYLFVGPAMVILTVFLIYPTIGTIWFSFFDANGEEFIWFDNYIFAFTNPDMLIALRNNVLWIVLVVGVTVSVGLLIAVLVDRMSNWEETTAKSLIFMPMAISAVGASVIWGFMYVAKPMDQTQIGLLNAMIVGLGGEPVLFLLNKSINNFALITIQIWLLTGFCMVILSSAVKGVPDELLEAARIDGANEFQVFFKILVPSIMATILTVATTVFIIVLKTFDIVYVMTNGRRDTEVVANRMFNELFRFGNQGHASALAVVLLLAVVPIIYWNLRSLREQRS
jgi:alpha-glucoside transport system permease protein